MAGYMRVEDLDVYQKLCRLHIEVCACVKSWPSEERFELCSQIRRSSNSSPANLAEKHSDRHVKNKIEGVNRARGEALETIHHLYIAHLKGFITLAIYENFRGRYLECVRMLNGIEKTLEKQLPKDQQRWNADYPPSIPESRTSTFYDNPDPRILNPEPRTLNPRS
jgi:four helix bundle protein